MMKKIVLLIFCCFNLIGMTKKSIEIKAIEKQNMRPLSLMPTIYQTAATISIDLPDAILYDIITIINPVYHHKIQRIQMYG